MLHPMQQQQQQQQLQQQHQQQIQQQQQQQRHLIEISQYRPRRMIARLNEFPRKFEVLVQARVRLQKDLSSPTITDLPEGTVVVVADIQSRRARIVKPIQGWLSVRSKFNARIIQPVDPNFSKIGSRVLIRNGLTEYPAKIIDFHENKKMHKVTYDDNNQSQWVDISSSDITIIAQPKQQQRSNKLSVDAPMFDPQGQAMNFFNNLFQRDYPNYTCELSPTTKAITTSSKVKDNFSINKDNNVPNGHTLNENNTTNINNNNNTKNNINVAPMDNNINNISNDQIKEQIINKEKAFTAKVTEIEKKIIDHLHQRGYTPEHPDYHRYLQKAKELALQKAKKDQNTKRRNVNNNNNNNNINNNVNNNNVNTNNNNINNQDNNDINNLNNPNIPPNHMTSEQYQLHKYMKYKEKKEQLINNNNNNNNNNNTNNMPNQINNNNMDNNNNNNMNDNNNMDNNNQDIRITNNNNNNNNNNDKITTNTNKNHGQSVKGLIVLRGLPGSGKTTLAKKLAARSRNAKICTEDKYHWSGKEDGVGEYKFQPQLVFLAREWCTQEIRKAIKEGVNLIILDNHNARISMYEEHILYAVKNGYRFRIIEFVASQELIDKYRKRSYKKFPREVYVKLLKLWEQDPRTELINPTFDEDDN